MTKRQLTDMMDNYKEEVKQSIKKPQTNTPSSYTQMSPTQKYQTPNESNQYPSSYTQMSPTQSLSQPQNLTNLKSSEKSQFNNNKNQQKLIRNSDHLGTESNERFSTNETQNDDFSRTQTAINNDSSLPLLRNNKIIEKLYIPLGSQKT